MGEHMDTLIHDSVSCARSVDDFLPACLGGWIWNPSRTDDYAVDCEHGRALADHIVKRMADDENALLLSTVARCIVEGGRWDAVEIGLFSRLAARLQ